MTLNYIYVRDLGVFSVADCWCCCLGLELGLDSSGYWTFLLEVLSCFRDISWYIVHPL